MSSSLVWEIVGKQSCFIYKKKGVVFNAEPNNLANLNKPHFSQFAQESSVNIIPKKTGGYQLIISKEELATYRFPKNSFETFDITEDFKNNVTKIQEIMNKKKFNKKLTNYILAKLYRLNQVEKRTNYLKKKQEKEEKEQTIEEQIEDEVTSVPFTPKTKSKETVEEPKETVEEPKETVEEPKETVEEPKETVEEPKETVEEPKETVEEPKETVEDMKVEDNN
ncbi:60S ribosomal protein L28 [Anaeramoeba ignava]|uniref:60S ribosomal protein L28 n=1 Tax=Anaeramoeba ignava TaxID=1746090 RepID=A0A9Q0LJ50_ANAIG|nr:60S ribosomal protein L28 [Anaeramoeba ignava]